MAAENGKCAAQVVLGFPSSVIKDGERKELIDVLIQILQLAKPQYVYTHNLADKHDTHVGFRA